MTAWQPRRDCGCQVPRRVEPIGLVVLHLAQVLRALADDDVTRRARAAAAARVLERHVEVLGDVEKRLRLAVVRIRQLAVLELDGRRLAVDDEGDFGHINHTFSGCQLSAVERFSSRPSSTFLPASAACTERFIMIFGQVLRRVVEHVRPFLNRFAVRRAQHMLQSGERRRDALLLARRRARSSRSPGTRAPGASSRSPR